MKITADTNGLVRAITGDHEHQSRAAETALRKAELVAIPISALCELVWVLSQGYKIPSGDVAEAIRRLTKWRERRGEPACGGSRIGTAGCGR